MSALRNLTGWLLFSFLLASPGAWAEIRLTDLAGREVVLEQPAKKIILGEGRFLAVLGALGIERPIDYVAGMMKEFKLYDPASFNQFAKVYPEIREVPTFGHTSEDSVSVEKIILLNPDVAVFGLNGHGPGARSKHIIDRLEKAGIPILFIDFRQDPINNTAKSVDLVARALGKPEKGAQFTRMYQQKIDRVSERLKSVDPETYPKVLFDLRASTAETCCLTVAKGLFADMAKLAGGASVAEGLLPGPSGNLSTEYILSTEFDFYIGTAVGKMPKKGETNKSSNNLLAGTGVNNVAAQKSLNYVLEQRGFKELEPIKNRQAYLLWHHFYNSPLNIYVIERMATWFHPELFRDLEPEQTLNNLLAGFGPVDLSGNYSAGL